MFLLLHDCHVSRGFAASFWLLRRQDFISRSPYRQLRMLFVPLWEVSSSHKANTSPNKCANGNYSWWWGVPLDSRFSWFSKWINDNVLLRILLRKRSDLEKHWTITLAFLNSILRFSWIKNFWRKLIKLNQIHKLRPQSVFNFSSNVGRVFCLIEGK